MDVLHVLMHLLVLVVTLVMLICVLLVILGIMLMEMVSVCSVLVTVINVMLMAVISSRLRLDKSLFVSMDKIYQQYAIQAVKLAQIQTHNNATSVFQVSLS